MSKKILFAIAVIFMSIGVSDALQIKPDIKVYSFGSTTEFLMPAKDEATKNLISTYKSNPNDETLSALKNQIEANYNAAIKKKKEKLAKLEANSKKQIKIDEMKEIIDTIERDKESLVFWTLNRYTDNKLVSEAKNSTDGFIPLYDLGFDVSIADAPVTNAQYAEFIKDTGYKTPSVFEMNSEDYPVVNVSYYDALEYCNWLSKNDSNANYRLPSEKEWKLASNNINQKADVWEWTTTTKDSASKIVKGNFETKKNILTKIINLNEFRKSLSGYGDVGFRVIRVK